MLDTLVFKEFVPLFAQLYDCFVLLDVNDTHKHFGTSM